MSTKKFGILLGFLIICSFLTNCSKSPEFGVSSELAALRKENISEIEYALYMSIPSQKEIHIPARAEITFEIKKRQRIIIDYRLNDSSLISITVNSRVINTKLVNGHIVIPAWYIYKGINKVNIDFFAGEASLNRKQDFMYTLLVPDRASTVFPCFDQPDLKAKFNLTLEVPKQWTAVTNSKTENSVETDTSKIFVFGKTQPISTYLFAFAAGQFDTTSRTQNGRKIILYHRETDKKKANRNIDAIFNSHFHSLNWLENYTGIPYPFEKLDIVLIPDFQYSGMEHVGAIFYRDSKLLLDENSSLDQSLNQANLIAHEVSHQWFGNFVTMRWFNDVWMKEVFAGLMADKIVNPQFSQINHQLNFLLSHYPRAYSVDRTAGSNPIQQELSNLLFAGSLYGDIIYHKAPIAMMQLERTMGPDLFQQGVRKYLELYCMGNANWNELIMVLDSLTPTNLNTWSNAWIEQTEMPTIISIRKLDCEKGKKITISQKTKGNFIPMDYGVSIFQKNNSTSQISIKHNKPEIEAKFDSSYNNTSDILMLNSDGLGYGFFIPDTLSLKFLLNQKYYLNDDIARASNLISIYELFLNGKIDNKSYLEYLIVSLNREKESQIRNYILGCIETVWWQFMTQAERTNHSQFLEYKLFKLFNSKSITVDERKPIFNTYSRIVISHEAIENLIDYWNGTTQIDGVTLSEQDLTNLTYELVVRNIFESDSLLNIQQDRITNSDRFAKFCFIRRAVCNDEAIRDDFFHSLFNPSNRRPEPWVLEALRYFNHPLRAEHSIHYLTASLDLLPEIELTGDIFFPKMWLDAILRGHNSLEASKIVTDWLTTHPNVSENLKNKLRQSADLLLRNTQNH